MSEFRPGSRAIDFAGRRSVAISTDSLVARRYTTTRGNCRRVRLVQAISVQLRSLKSAQFGSTVGRTDRSVATSPARNKRRVRALWPMRVARRAATYAGRTTCSTKYMRKRTSPPVSTTDASAQSDASIVRIRARPHAANATQTGTTTPTRTWPDPGPLPGGFGLEPPAQTPRIGATTRQIGASQTRGRNLCVASASTLARHRHLRPVLKATASGDIPAHWRSEGAYHSAPSTPHLSRFRRAQARTRIPRPSRVQPPTRFEIK